MDKSFKENFMEFARDWKLNRIGHYLKILLVVLFIIVEEIAWKRIGEPAYRKIKSLKIMIRFKTWLSDINHRYMLLAIFLIPFILMEVSSIFAVKALASGAIITGIGLYTIKLLLTAPVVIIFNAGKEILVSFSVIKYSYGMILRFKRSGTFRSVKRFTKKLKDELKIFNNDYLDSDNGDFSKSFEKMYHDIKNV